MLTTDDLELAPMFTVFHGLKGKCTVPPEVQDNWWDEFSMHGATVFDEAVARRASELEIKVKRDGSHFIEIEADDERSPREFTDDDAVLCFLNKGGVVAKLPDELNSDHWRYYVVETP